MITLATVTEANSGVLANLFQFFCHDLANLDEPMPMEDGRYVVEHFSIYYSHPGMKSFLICENDVPVGFVVVSVPPHFMDAFCVQHLFVLNGYRRKGIAMAAMVDVFGAFPGAYRVGQAFGNEAAVEFWKKLYAQEGITYEETVEGEGLDKERVQRFVVNR